MQDANRLIEYRPDNWMCVDQSVWSERSSVISAISFSMTALQAAIMIQMTPSGVRHSSTAASQADIAQQHRAAEPQEPVIVMVWTCWKEEIWGSGDLDSVGVSATFDSRMIITYKYLSDRWARVALKIVCSPDERFWFGV